MKHAESAAHRPRERAIPRARGAKRLPTRELAKHVNANLAQLKLLLKGVGGDRNRPVMKRTDSRHAPLADRACQLARHAICGI